MNTSIHEQLRHSVRFFYDLQKLRVQTGNRVAASTRRIDDGVIELDEDQIGQMGRRSASLKEMERSELKQIKSLITNFTIVDWILAQRGVGPTMTGVILSEVDIHRAETPSALWSYAGLAVVDGKAPRPQKGQKLPYNAWLRTKLVGVMADCMIKAGSEWRQLYDNYKLRKESMLVTCMGCGGSGEGKKDGAKCATCKGKGGKQPWGQSKGHRHNAAKRYMVKMFLLELWKQWRQAEGLPVHDDYATAKLGRTHGDHAAI